MASDMVGRGSFHRHRMTSGGRTARPARTAQSDGDRKLPAIPTAQTADTQTAVTVALMESSCMVEVYGPAVRGAVPECTCRVSATRQDPSGTARRRRADRYSGGVRSGTADRGSVRYSV